MALGDLMSSRFSQSSAAVSNHLDECSNHGDMDFVGQRRDRDFDTASSSYGNVTTTTTITTTATSMAYLPQTIVLCDLRHEAFEDCVPAGPSDSGLVSKWRPKDRMKTGCVALVLCLNISVDPPDVIKISPCARMECWIDPFAMAPQKALETIGKTLSLQYERWQPRARYKTQLDPTVEEVKKLCTTCRKYAKWKSSDKCTLILTEGVSAKALAGMYLLSNVASGNEFHKEAVMDQLFPQIGDNIQSIMIKFLQSNDSMLRTACVWTVVNLTFPSSPGAHSRVAKLQNACITSQLKDMVNDPCLDVKRQMSVVQIEHSEMMERGKPKPGGLSDPRLGTIDRKMKCETCMANMAECPGHFGHLELAKPMFLIFLPF